jgi:hypothetical protein
LITDTGVPYAKGRSPKACPATGRLAFTNYTDDIDHRLRLPGRGEGMKPKVPQ